MCGRDHSAACTRATSTDGRELVSCYHGGKCSAPDGLSMGDKFIGKDGRVWGFVRRYRADCLGDKSLFIEHEDRGAQLSRHAPTISRSMAANGQQHEPPKVDPQQQAQGADPAPEAAGKAKKGGAVKLRPDQVRDLLPRQVGQLRLNLRTG